MIKQNNMNKISNALLVLLMIINNIAFYSKNFYSIISIIAVYMNFIILLGLIFLNGKLVFKKIYIFYITVVMIYCSILLVININTGLGSVITLITGILAFFVFSRYYISNKVLKIYTFILSLLYIYLFLLSDNYMQKFTLYPDQYINSNIIAVAALYIAIYLFNLLPLFKIPYRKLLSFLSILLGIMIILNCKSRASLLALFIFILFYYFIPKKFLLNKRFLKIVFISVIIIGSIMPFIIITLYKRNIDIVVPFINKPLYTGREIIWSQMIELQKENPVSIIFGLGSKVKTHNGELLVAHNSYAAIIVNFGIVGYILVFGFIVRQFNKILKSIYLSKDSVKYLLGFICIFIHGFFEYIFLNPLFVIPTFLFLGLAIRMSNTIEGIDYRS